MELKDKKILFVSTTDNMYWQFLIPHIEYLKTEGANVECVCSKTGFFFDELESQYGIKMHEINFTRFPFTLKNLRARKRLFNLVKQNNYDLICCQQPVGGVMGRMVGHKFRIPVIYTAHGFHFYKGCSLKTKLIYKTIEKHYSRYTDALVTMNEEDFFAAKEMYAKKVYKINGIGLDLNKYKTDNNFNRYKFREGLGLNKDDFVVISIGELNKNKNTLMLIDAIKKIDNPKVKYLICGTGKLREKYEHKIIKNKLEDRVKLLGYRNDVTELLQISNVFVLPSFREGLPKSLMEGMAYGLPIIGSKIRGVIDLVGENEGGILLNPNDVESYAKAYEKLSKDKTLCEKYGNRNKEIIKNYSIETVLEQMKKVYEEI